MSDDDVLRELKWEPDDTLLPCTCPQPVVDRLQLAVDYVKAGGGSEDQMLGAYAVKTFMEQPAEVWCNYLVVPIGGNDATL